MGKTQSSFRIGSVYYIMMLWRREFAWVPLTTHAVTTGSASLCGSGAPQACGKDWASRPTPMNSDSRPGRSTPSGLPEMERNDWGAVARLWDRVFSGSVCHFFYSPFFATDTEWEERSHSRNWMKHHFGRKTKKSTANVAVTQLLQTLVMPTHANASRFWLRNWSGKISPLFLSLQTQSATRASEKTTKESSRGPDPTCPAPPGVTTAAGRLQLSVVGAFLFINNINKSLSEVQIRHGFCWLA